MSVHSTIWTFIGKEDLTPSPARTLSAHPTEHHEFETGRPGGGWRKVAKNMKSYFPLCGFAPLREYF